MGDPVTDSPPAVPSASSTPLVSPSNRSPGPTRGQLMLSPLLRLMLMLTTAMVDMVDTAMDMVDTVMVMEDTVMDMDMATVVDTVMDMAMVTTDKLRGQIMFVQYCAIAILF